MYRDWKDWSFADKKHPSPWLTFLIYRVFKRISQQRPTATGDHTCS
jgi:hypothetical protein